MDDGFYWYQDADEGWIVVELRTDTWMYPKDKRSTLSQRMFDTKGREWRELPPVLVLVPISPP